MLKAAVILCLIFFNSQLIAEDHLQDGTGGANRFEGTSYQPYDGNASDPCAPNRYGKSYGSYSQMFSIVCGKCHDIDPNSPGKFAASDSKAPGASGSVLSTAVSSGKMPPPGDSSISPDQVSGLADWLLNPT